MTLDHWITQAAERNPDHTALDYEGERLTYAEFAAKIDRRARELAGQGVVRGDRVVWYGLNHPEVFVLLFACARVGAMLVPLNWRLSAGEIVEITEDCAPKLVFHDAHFAKAVAGWAMPCYPLGSALQQADISEIGYSEDPILLVYTSGSTGRPKGVVLAQKALAANAAMSVKAHELSDASRVLNVLPLFHVGGLNILPTPAFSVGGTVVLHERFDPDAMCDALQSVTHAITVPTVMQAVMGSTHWEGADLSGLVSLSIGSTDVPVAIIEEVHKRGVPVMQIYGATETSPLAIYQSVNDAMTTVGSLGRAGSFRDIKLMEGDVEVPDGTPARSVCVAIIF